MRTLSRQLAAATRENEIWAGSIESLVTVAWRQISASLVSRMMLIVRESWLAELPPSIHCKRGPPFGHCEAVSAGHANGGGVLEQGLHVLTEKISISISSSSRAFPVYNLPHSNTRNLSLRGHLELECYIVRPL